MSKTAQDPVIKTTDQEEAEHIQSVAGNLNAAGYNISPKDVAGSGTEAIGEDLTHIVGTTMGDLTYGVTKIRTTKSNKFLGMLKGRLFRKKNSDEEVVEK